MFSFSDFLFFCIGQYIVCIGGPNFKIFFVSLMYSWFLNCVYNIFVLGSKFQDMFFCVFYFLFSALHFLYWGSKIQDIFLIFFLCFFIFCIRQYIFCIGGPNFRICLFFSFLIYLYISIFLMFFFGGGQYILCIGGPIFRICFLFFILCFLGIFLYWAIHPLFGGFQISGYIFVL